MTATAIMEAPIRPATSQATDGEPESSTLNSLILKSLDEDGASDVVVIDLKGKSAESDTMVIASGRSTRHVSSIATKLVDKLKQDAGIIPRAEGLDAADWVLIDTGDVIVHVFRPEVREFYQLEKMWAPAPDATARAAAVG